MALDGIAVAALVREFRTAALGAKIDKIYQPEKDEITLALRNRGDAYKLLLSASASNPRAYLTQTAFQNPINAPMFCMLLRKRIGGGKIVDITQPGFERIIDFCIEAYTELGDLAVRHLIIEIMGRHSNIILTDSDGRIADSVKHIGANVSSRRLVLPSLAYALPPAQDKISPLTATEAQIASAVAKAQAGIKADRFILDTFAGISPVVAREVCYRALGAADTYVSEMTGPMRLRLIEAVCSLFSAVRNGSFSPCVIYDNATGRPLDFAAIAIAQYGNAARVEGCGTVSEAAERFYAVRDTAERKKQKSAGLDRVIGNNIDRCAKKLTLLYKTLEDAKNKDSYKRYADLLTANLYRLREGAAVAEVEDFYAEAPGMVLIVLDPSLSSQANAQRYYKKYAKAKTAETEASRQVELACDELSYLESIRQSCSMASTEQELGEIRSELAAGGYIKKSGGKDKRKQQKSEPLHFISSDGFDIYCGKNNLQNDYLTLRLANSADLWFHTKNIPGSHTVIKLGTDKDVPDSTIREAAMLAALHSSAKNGSQVPVDYTQIKNVKKPSGAKPGMVIYDHYNTLYVTPDETLVPGLKAP